MQLFSLVLLVTISLLKSGIDCSDTGPLILTPLLEAGKYKEAQEKSLIVPAILGVKGYSGYFTVNKSCDSNLFFWFTPAEQNWESAPVVLWLNAGPGCTSMFGLFLEIGPFEYVRKKNLVKREHSWSKKHNVLYLDQPAGTGFSFSIKKCYPKDMNGVSQEAYRALVQFFTLFPNLQKNKFFITGESFSGHYIPALALEIDKQNEKAKLKINQVGVMIGNPVLDDRCSQVAAYLYQLGIVDEKSRDAMLKLETEFTTAINKGNATQIFEIRSKITNIIDSAGFPSYYNVLYDRSFFNFYHLYLRSYETRKIIHVGSTPFNSCSDDVFNALSQDRFAPASSNLQKLLQTNKYTVGIYSGQLDIVCMYVQVPCVLRQLKWSGAAGYLAANRSKWYVDDRLAGWFKTSGNLFEVVVRDSGHYVPTDQPAAALDLLTAFIHDTPGTRLLTRLKTEDEQ